MNEEKRTWETHQMHSLIRLAQIKLSEHRWLSGSNEVLEILVEVGGGQDLTSKYLLQV